MSDFAKASIKNHGKSILRMIYCHVLAVCLGWAAFPLIMFLFARYIAIYTPMSVFTLFATVIYIMIILASSNEQGRFDRKPYRWAKYSAKGFVCGAVAGVFVYLITLLFIAIANKYFRVQDPTFNITNINSYVRMVPMVPFFWFFNLINTTGNIVPRVTALNALVVIPFMSVISGVGYLLGRAGIVIDFVKKRKGDDELPPPNPNGAELSAEDTEAENSEAENSEPEDSEKTGSEGMEKLTEDDKYLM